MRSNHQKKTMQSTHLSESQLHNYHLGPTANTRSSSTCQPLLSKYPLFSSLFLVEVQALVDSGLSNCFVDFKFVTKYDLPQKRTLTLIDGSSEHTVSSIVCYNSEPLTRSNCDKNPRQPCILSSSLTRGSG